MTAKEAKALADEHRPKQVETELQQAMETIKLASWRGRACCEIPRFLPEVRQKLIELGYKYEHAGGSGWITWHD